MNLASAWRGTRPSDFEESRDGWGAHAARTRPSDFAESCDGWGAHSFQVCLRGTRPSDFAESCDGWGAHSRHQLACKDVGR